MLEHLILEQFKISYYTSNDSCRHKPSGTLGNIRFPMINPEWFEFINTISKIDKKLLIIGLLNKEYIKNIKLPISNKYNNKYTINWNDLSNNFDNYLEDINILHLVIFHNIDIDKLLIFLLFLYFHFYNNSMPPFNLYPKQKTYYYDFIVSTYDVDEYLYILYAEIKNIYYDVINSADKFDKYIYYYNHDYESLFLSDYNKIIELEDKLYKLNEINEIYNNKLLNIYSSIQILKDNQDEYKINYTKKYNSINDKLDIIKSDFNKKYFILANKFNDLSNNFNELSNNFNELFTKINNLSNRYIYNYIYKIINLYSNIKNRLLKNNTSN